MRLLLGVLAVWCVLSVLTAIVIGAVLRTDAPSQRRRAYRANRVS